MATENQILDLSFEAAEDLSSDQYSFVVLTSTGTVRRPDSEAEVALGVLQNAPASGEAAVVRILGTTKVTTNALLAIGTFVMQEYVSATDAGKAKTSAGAPAYTRGVIIEASSAEDDLATILLTSTFPAINDAVQYITTVTTDNTAGANTWSAAEMIGGLMLRDPAGADRSDVTTTAALLVAAIAGAQVGSGFQFTIRNTADANETITLTAGAGVTLSGAMTIPQNYERRFVAVCTNVGSGTEAVTVYDVGLSRAYHTARTDFYTVTTDTTVGANTWTAAELLGGMLLRDPSGADRSDVTPTAALIVAAIPNCVAGTGFEFVLKNTADGDEVITLTAGVGVTLSPTSITVRRGYAYRYLAVITNAGSGTEAVTIYQLNMLPDTVARQYAAAIADPGNAGAISVKQSGVCAMTSAGAETRTIAIPSFIGQEISLIDDTHVGNIVVTAASAINQAGNTIMTFGAAADAIVLKAMTVGGTLVWRVTANDGVALS
jgi:hypothetical protein